MKRLALTVAIAALAAVACQRADRQSQAADTTQMMSDTSKMMSDSAMARDTAKPM